MGVVHNLESSKKITSNIIIILSYKPSPELVVFEDLGGILFVEALLVEVLLQIANKNIEKQVLEFILFDLFLFVN